MSNYSDKPDSQNQYPSQPQQPSSAPMPPIPPTQYPPQSPQYPYPPVPQNPYSSTSQPPQYPYPPVPQDPYSSTSQPPQYPYPPVPQAPKKSKALLWWIIGGIVGVLALCGLCSLSVPSILQTPKANITGTTSNQQTTSTTTVTPQSTDTTSNGGTDSSTSTSSSSNVVANVGQTITVPSSNLACTLVSVKPLDADEFDQPTAGHKFIYVHVKLTNNGSSEQEYDSYSFHVMDGSGNITDSAFAPESYTANNQLSSGKLAPGGKVEGDIIFQVPTGDHKVRLTWSPSFLDSSSQYMWNLGL